VAPRQTATDARTPTPIGEPRQAASFVPTTATLRRPEPVSTPQKREYFVGVDHPNASDSNSGLSPDHPFKTLSRGVAPLSPGDTLSIMEGVYREVLGVGVDGLPDSPIVVRAYPGDEGSVVIRGSDVVTGWTHDGGDVWSVPWQPLPLLEYPPSYPDVDEFARRREMVFVNGDPLEQVLSPTGLAAGRFWVDDGVGRIRIHYQGDPNTAGVEIAARSEGVMARGRSHHVYRGLRVEHVTTEMWIGAMALGPHARVENCRVEHNNGNGIEAYADSVILSTHSNHNGRLGIALAGNNSLLDSCETSHNSWRYGPEWDAGGIKVAAANLPSGIRIARHTSGHNNGPGVWLDTVGSGNVIEASLLEGNVSRGLEIEAAIGPNWVINNVIDGTVKANDGSTPDGAGISLLVARDTYIYNNTIVDAGGPGIVIGGSDRDYGVFYPANTLVFNNIIVNPGTAAVWFWLWDEGLIPERFDSHHFDNNLYYDADPVVWIPLGDNNWTLAEFQQNRGEDLHSLYAPPMFADPASRDFSLLETSPAIDRGRGLLQMPEDRLGTHRPQGRRIDMGALERLTTAPRSDPNPVRRPTPTPG